MKSTPMLREVNSVMEAHILAETITNGKTSVGAEESGANETPSGAAFTGAVLESSRKYGGPSILYYGKV